MPALWPHERVFPLLAGVLLTVLLTSTARPKVKFQGTRTHSGVCEERGAVAFLLFLCHPSRLSWPTDPRFSLPHRSKVSSASCRPAGHNREQGQ
jgi:hypothetical protein